MMNRTILSVAALLAAAVALAGCGGSMSASGTTSGVAGAHHTKAGGSFSASAHGFEARIQTSVQKFETGDIGGAASSAGSLLTSCTSTVNSKLAPKAATPAQIQAITHLRIACSDMSKATHAGMSGNLTKAKQFAKAALKQTQIAARLSG
jgi:predicted small secreted protein